MLRRGTGSGRSLAKNTIKAFVLLELGGVVAGYFIYRNINTDPEIRYNMSTNRYSRSLLEWYYRTGEYINPNLRIRESDLDLWRRQGKEV